MNSKFLFASVLALGIGFTGCKKTETFIGPDPSVTTPIDSVTTPTDTTKYHPSNKGKSNEVVNDWIYDVMDIFYLWGDKMPAKTATNLKAEPDAFFGSLLNQYGTVDRFSWIDEDVVSLTEGLQGVSKSSGISVTPFRVSDTGNSLIFSVRYVIKGTPGEKAGVKRGDIITKVNGTNITIDNYQTILNPEQLVLGFSELTASGLVSLPNTITVNKAQIQNLPVHFSNIIEKGNSKIGYMVYNQFIPGVAANGKMNTQFDDEIRGIFTKFKSENINELILDFRFNGGGYISSSSVISSLVVSNLTPGTLMNKEIWSKNGEAYVRRYWNYKDSNFENKWITEASNIGNNLKRVFVLVSGNTASASELVINNLKPHMEVILIGTNTYGKDVGSITLDDEANKYRWNWGLQPIVLRTVNSKGEANYGTKDGFTPNYIVNDNSLPWQEFGSEDETLMKKALEVITGKTTTPRAKTRNEKTYSKVESLGGFDNARMNITDMFVEKK